MNFECQDVNGHWLCLKQKIAGCTRQQKTYGGAWCVWHCDGVSPNGGITQDSSICKSMQSSWQCIANPFGGAESGEAMYICVP